VSRVRDRAAACCSEVIARSAPLTLPPLAACPRSGLPSPLRGEGGRSGEGDAASASTTCQGRGITTTPSSRHPMASAGSAPKRKPAKRAGVSLRCDRLARSSSRCRFPPIAHHPRRHSRRREPGSVSPAPPQLIPSESWDPPIRSRKVRVGSLLSQGRSAVAVTRSRARPPPPSRNTHDVIPTQAGTQGPLH
jgi:hypothetical protein